MRETWLNGSSRPGGSVYHAPVSTGRYPEDHGDSNEDPALLSLGDLLQVLRRRLWMIVVVALISTTAAVGLSLLQTPVYEASIRMLVGQDQGLVSGENPSQAQGLQDVTMTMTELANTRTVADGVIQELDLSATPDQFLGNMTVQQTEQTQVIQITYSHPDPEMAATVADTTGEVFSEQVSEVSSDANAVTATVWEEASAPDTPSSPQPFRNGALALIMGLMLGVGLAFLREHLDDSWRSPEEAEAVSGVPTFGVIRTFEAPKKSPRKEEKDAPSSLES